MDCENVLSGGPQAFHQFFSCLLLSICAGNFLDPPDPPIPVFLDDRGKLGFQLRYSGSSEKIGLQPSKVSNASGLGTPITRSPHHSPGRAVFPHPVPRLHSLIKRTVTVTRFTAQLLSPRGEVGSC
jgi:hypothetical protein